MMTLVLLDVASKAARMAEQDPNGWIMTLVAVCVVFLTLFLLQYCYRFVGWLSTRKKGAGTDANAKNAGARTDGSRGTGLAGSAADGEVAAAIATALSMETSGEIQAAIGLALDRWFSESIHDKESYIITIKRK